MASTNYTLLVARIRRDASDPAAGTFKPQETPQGVRDGSNKVFRLQYPNLVAGSLYLTYGGSARSNSGFTILDAPTGYISMATAPDAGTTQPFFFDYAFQWFLDADYESWIDAAGDELGVAAGTDPGENLYPTVCFLALERFWLARASQFASLYQTSGGGASADPAKVTANFLALAKAARADSEKARLNAYVDPGKKLKPASGTITGNISRYTPKR